MLHPLDRIAARGISPAALDRLSNTHYCRMISSKLATREERRLAYQSVAPSSEEAAIPSSAAALATVEDAALEIGAHFPTSLTYVIPRPRNVDTDDVG